MTTARKTDHTKLAIGVMPTNLYNQSKLVAKVYEIRNDIGGEGDQMYGLSYNHGFDNGGEYDGLTISAYIDYEGIGDRDARGVWGRDVFYDDTRIETAEHARAIAKVLTRIETGLRKLENAHGYLPDKDYGAYVFRVAGILGVKAVYRHNSPKGREMTGQRYTRVDALQLQSWVSHVVSEKHAGRFSELIR